MISSCFFSQYFYFRILDTCNMKFFNSCGFIEFNYYYIVMQESSQGEYREEERKVSVGERR